MELSEIENLWYILGILLGIPKAKLDQIQANYGSGPWPHGRCLIETISQWKDNHENATWSSIVQALYSMQKKQLAKRVATKHSKLMYSLLMQTCILAILTSIHRGNATRSKRISTGSIYKTAQSE